MLRNDEALIFDNLSELLYKANPTRIYGAKFY